MEFKPGSFKEVTWDEVRLTIKKITPDMFEAIVKLFRNRANKAKYLMSDFRKIQYVIEHFFEALRPEIKWNSTIFLINMTIIFIALMKILRVSLNQQEKYFLVSLTLSFGVA
jgi:hypothetical protein